MTTVVVATGNPGKLAELKAYLQVLDWTLAMKPEKIEVEETGETFIENARLKASEVAIATQSWAIATQIGLLENCGSWAMSPIGGLNLCVRAPLLAPTVASP